MDPNANLTKLREIAARVIADYASDEGVVENDSIELAEAVKALDEWLTKGGFLPETWAKAPRTAPVETGDALPDLLQTLSQRITADRHESESYRVLAAEPTLINMLRRAEMDMTGIALDVSEVLKQRWNIHLRDRDRWTRLLGLSRWREELATQFAKETHVGNVDRAFSAIADDLRTEAN